LYPRTHGGPGLRFENLLWHTAEVRVTSCLGSLGGPPSSRCRSVIVVQRAEDRDRDDRGAEPFGRALTAYGNPLADPLVRSSRVEVVHRVFSKDMPEVRLRQDHDVIDAFAPDAPQKSFAHRVDEGRLDGGAQSASTGALGNAVERRTELMVAVAADHAARSIAHGEGESKRVGYLVLFDARKRDFGTGLSSTTTVNASTVRVVFVDVRPEAPSSP
jgi:hypothetical protein